MAAFSLLTFLALPVPCIAQAQGPSDGWLLTFSSDKGATGKVVSNSPGNVITQDPAAISWAAPSPSSHNNMGVQGFGVGGGAGCGPGQSCSVHATAGLTFNISAAWQGSSPPLPVILRETSVASFTGSDQANATNFGSAMDGINDPQVATSTGGVSQTSSSGTPAHYSGQSGSSWHIDRTLSADGTQSVTAPPNNGAGAGMSVGVGAYSLDIYPITLNPGGATLDSARNYNILVGQGCTASLSGLPTFPSGYTVSYQWSVSGTTFQDWGPSSPLFPDASYFIGGYGPSTNPTAHWYWNDAQQTPETVTCTVTVTPPAGQGAAFTVTVTQKVTVQVPTWRATGTGGYMQVNTKAPHDAEYELWGSMDWNATVTTPTTPAFGQGSLELVQIITPNVSYTTYTSPVENRNDPDNGMTGLDISCPIYGHVSMESGPPYVDADTPGLQLTVSGANPAGSAVIQDAFSDYIMYLPPGSDVKWIPIAAFPWSTNGNATIPTSGNWSDYVKENFSDVAGTVTPSTATPFKPWNTHPSWTQVFGNNTY